MSLSATQPLGLDFDSWPLQEDGFISEVVGFTSEVIESTSDVEKTISEVVGANSFVDPALSLRPNNTALARASLHNRLAFCLHCLHRREQALAKEPQR